ncbi:MAG: sporulation protein YqfC [Oscillospiraceae bacterium]|nr:sporulation protein YqfC [Oscillospiraceae bacterium]
MPSKNRNRNRNRNPSPDNAMPQQPSGIKVKIAEALDVSKDIVLNLPRIVLIGTGELTIENYEGILEYSENLISIGANGMKIKIVGKKLEIRTITAEMLFITGFVQNVGLSM